MAASVVGIGDDGALRQLAHLGDLGGLAAPGPQRPPQAEGHLDQGLGRGRLEFERFSEQAARHVGVGAREPIEVPASTPDQVVEFQAVLALAAGAHLLSIADLRVEHAYQSGDQRIQRVLRALRRQRQAVRPEGGAVGRVQQAERNREAAACSAQATFEDILGAEALADQARIGLVGGEGETRVAGDHRQPAQPREPVDQILAQALADIVVDVVIREVGEGQDGQRRPVVEARGR